VLILRGTESLEREVWWWMVRLTWWERVVVVVMALAYLAAIWGLMR
jgi:hypothetical protein